MHAETPAEDLLLCFDRHFILPTGALIWSIAAYNPNRSFCLHLCSPRRDLPRTKDLLVKRISQELPLFSCELYAFEDFSGYKDIAEKVNARMSAQCVRLFAGELRHLHGTILLYLDSDIICCGQIPDFNRLAIAPQAAVLATRDFTGPKEVCGTQLNDYFNSGVLFINLPVWQELGAGAKCVELVCRYRPKFPDQDALNAALQDHWQPLPINLQGMWQMPAGCVFLHYISGKPWEPWDFRINPEMVNRFRQAAKKFEPNVSRWISFKAHRDVYINFTEYKARTANNGCHS